MDQQPPAIAERLLAAQVEVQAHTDRDARWVESLFSAFMASFYYWQAPSPLVLAWLALRIAVHLTGQQMSRRYLADAGRARRGRRWAQRYTAFSTFDGAAWGAGTWLLPAAGDPLQHGVAVIVITVASSAAIYATQVWSVVLAWVLPMNAALVAALLWQREPVFLFMAACVVVNLGLVLHFGRQQPRLMTEALRMRFEKEALAEQLAQQVWIARQADQEKTRFLAAASHDLRQPMHAITLFGAVLEKALADHPQRANAARLMRAVDALSISFTTLLDVSRLDAGAVVATQIAAPLNPVLRALSQTFVPLAEERGLQLRLRATPLWVQTDPQLLQRLLANLLDNALKYTPRGGVLVVARARGTAVWIDVCDTGIGIEADDHDAIFREFYQLDNPGRDRRRGLGMGLAIVQRLARLLQHEVRLHSRPGRGSCFRVVLAAAAGALPGPQSGWVESDPDPAPVGRQPLPRHVLLVDDEGDIASAMQVVMQDAGVHLARARDPDTARALCTQAQARGVPFEALICDLRLAEGVDGLALALALRAEYAGSARLLPTLIVTGETAPEPIQRVRASGLAVLFKPVSASALLQVLADLTKPAG
ncbi:MAG TPA: ATP-binding protein [Ottowia sp.]|uniref:ATP-binding response regulator n=1 Tax=Ottowia sp. TaxID=1898956 RepID=UPI002C181B85|nr:ATP-binding protein [Ottowia sp.]HMN20961.1 ATP-binding protein [Ottowia sp.]